MATFTTDGFRVGVMPETRFVDPRLVSPRYGDILPAVGQGLSLYDQFQTMPTRRRLGEIQLQEAENRLGLAPIQQQLARAQLDEALQNAATPRVLPGNVMIEDQTKFYPAALDEEGRPTGDGERVMGDLVQIQEEQLVGPGGVVTPRVVRKTIKAAADREAESAYKAAQIDATRALGEQRRTGKDFESTRLVELYNNAVQEGDLEAARLYKARIDRLNQAPGILPEGTAYNRRIEQLAADAGVTLDAARELAQNAQGAELLAKAAVANKAAARSVLPPTINAEERAQLRAPGADYQASITETLQRGRPAAGGGTPTFNSVAEAEAAAQRGQIKPGQKIIVGGRSATWQE